MKITKEKAEILGLLCSEGSHGKYYYSYWEYSNNRGKYYYRKNKKTERIDFSNKNKKLLRHFKKLIDKVYKVNNSISYVSERVYLGKKFIMEDLLRYTEYGYDKWRVPKEVLNGTKEVKASFLRGLYEGDGTKLNWRGKQPYIDFHMYNLPGLKKVKKLLNQLNIECKIYIKISRLVIKGRDVVRFSEIVNPKYRPIKMQGAFAGVLK